MNSEHPNTMICPDKKIGDYHFSTGFLDLDAWRNTRKLRFLCCNLYADENIQITRKLAKEFHSKKNGTKIMYVKRKKTTMTILKMIL